MNDKTQEERRKDGAMFERQIRCPIHKKLIGKYDARFGLINSTHYCPHCKVEYTFTIPRENIFCEKR